MDDIPSIVSDVQRLIRQSPMSSYQIAKLAGIDLKQLRTFELLGKHLSIRSIGKVLDVLGGVRIEAAEADPTEQPIDQPSEQPTEPPPELRSTGSGIDALFLNSLT